MKTSGIKQSLLAAAAVFICIGSHAAGGWEKSGKNPLLGNSKLGTCFDVNVVTDGPAPYTMYFSWRPKKSIAFVRSDDAENWTQEPEICLEPDPSTGWEENLNRTTCVKKDGLWHMWYTGQKDDWSRIGYATSGDGVKFTRVTREPVMVPEAEFEKKSVMNPYVRWDAKRGVWRMWYAAGETYEPDVICYAESKDGIKWEKSAKNPVFTKGGRLAWDRHKVGAVEVHPLADGRWVMFYIGYYDTDTAAIGAAVSDDGVTEWKRFDANPIVAPDLGEWDACACYKPSVYCDRKNNRWLLWYNGRHDASEYVGMAEHRGLDLFAAAEPPAEPERLLKKYVENFNRNDNELYTNAIPNDAAEKFMLENVPLFACPDKAIERTYYFRWWTYRKHLRHDMGKWTVTEFLPNVPWAGPGNMIVCPAGHHFREGRWLRDPKYLVDNARFWLADERSEVRYRYCSWLFTSVCQLALVHGLDSLPEELLDDAVRYYRRWEEGFMRGGWPHKGDFRMGGDGEGGFLSIDNYEGSELSLGGHGYKPLMSAAMWSEANAIATVAAKAGRKELAAEFAAKATMNASVYNAKGWNRELGFYVTTPKDGPVGTIRELNGYAPWYFGFPVGDRKPDFSQLFDPRGFYGMYGLTYPEHRAPGFKVAYEGHECQWNGPSWPYSTSIALTAYSEWLKRTASGLQQERTASGQRQGGSVFSWLMHQYAMQHSTWKHFGGKMLPWIDENFNAEKPDWISRTLLMKRRQPPVERGKDYNHSTFCDLVISGLVGFTPKADGSFEVKPLCPPEWDYFVLKNLAYRGKTIDIFYRKGEGVKTEVR